MEAVAQQQQIVNDSLMSVNNSLMGKGREKRELEAL